MRSLLTFVTFCSLVNHCLSHCYNLYENSACQFQYEEDIADYGKECCVYARLEHCLRLEEEAKTCSKEIERLMLNETRGTSCDDDWEKLRFSDHSSPLFHMPSKCLFFFYWKQLIIDGLVFVFLILVIWCSCFHYFKHKKRTLFNDVTIA